MSACRCRRRAPTAGPTCSPARTSRVRPHRAARRSTRRGSAIRSADDTVDVSVGGEKILRAVAPVAPGRDPGHAVDLVGTHDPLPGSFCERPAGMAPDRPPRLGIVPAPVHISLKAGGGRTAANPVGREWTPWTRLASETAVASGNPSLCASVTCDGRSLAGTASSDRGIGMLPSGSNGANRPCRREVCDEQAGASVAGRQGGDGAVAFVDLRAAATRDLPAVDQDRTQGDRLVRGRGAELHRDLVRARGENGPGRDADRWRLHE